MNIDFGSFFNDAGAKVEASLNDLVKVGTPAIKASLEQWGIDVLQQMNKETNQELNKNVKELLAKDPAPGSLGAAVSATVQGSVLNMYGFQITLAVAGLIVIGFMLRGK